MMLSTIFSQFLATGEDVTKEAVGAVHGDSGGVQAAHVYSHPCQVFGTNNISLCTSVTDGADSVRLHRCVLVAHLVQEPTSQHTLQPAIVEEPKFNFTEVLFRDSLEQ